jgi:16S rRNA (guanine527-N7)-methyltransferase
LTEPGLRERLGPVLDLLAADPGSLSSVRDRDRAWRVHVEDSLSGLEAVGEPQRLADVGAGAGFPGLVLAAALPAAAVDLIESVARKCEFIERAIAAARLDNARAICARAETWGLHREPGGGREAYDVVTARAVGRLATVAELAVPLLRPGGRLVAWKGRRDPEEEAELERAAGSLAIAVETVRRVPPAPGAAHRHLHVLRKVGPTPAGLPRRPGIAKKRPFGAVGRRAPGPPGRRRSPG